MDLEKLLQDINSDIVLFAKTLMKSLITSEIPNFHKEIYSLITCNDRIVIAAPRGFAKSAVISRVYPLWLALLNKKRDICIISASESLAIEHLRWIKTEIEQNKLVKLLFGNCISPKWSENHIILSNNVNIRARGAGGQIRGFRPDCLILDDIESDESVESEDQRRKLREWLFKACINTLLPTGQLIVIGTLIHPLCLLNELLTQERDGWIRKKYTAYIDGIEEKGHELWAEQRSHEFLQQRKSEIGSMAFAAEYMNNPVVSDASPIKEEYIRFYDKLPEQMQIVLSVDPAYSEDSHSDYKVCVAVGLDEKNNRYLITYLREHCPSGEFIDLVINMYLRDKNRIVAVEVPAGSEREFYNKVVEKSMQRGIGMPIVELKNTFTTNEGRSIRKKTRRIVAALQPLFEQGKYFINRDHTEARDELLTLGYSQHDDIVDALCYAEQLHQPTFTFKEEQDVDRYGIPEENQWQVGYNY